MDTNQILQAIRSEISRLQEVAAILGHGASPSSKKTAATGRKKRRKLSAAGRARIAAAQKARWAKIRAAKKK